MPTDRALEFSQKIVKLALEELAISAGEVAQGQLIALCAWAQICDVSEKDLRVMLEVAWGEVETRVVTTGTEEGAGGG